MHEKWAEVVWRRYFVVLMYAHWTSRSDPKYRLIFAFGTNPFYEFWQRDTEWQAISQVVSQSG